MITNNFSLFSLEKLRFILTFLMEMRESQDNLNCIIF